MNDWRPTFDAMGAVWVRPDDPAAPHVGVLKSPTHQDEYFNSDYVAQDLVTLRSVAEEWADVLVDHDMVPDRVMSHAPFGTAPAVILTHVFNERGLPTLFGHAPRDSEGGYSTTFPVMPGERVVVLADDVISGDSTRKVIQDAERRGAVVLGMVPCLGNLSLRPDLDGRPFIAAATFEPVQYRVDKGGQCDLCHIGSTPLAPRSNWDELQRWHRRPSAG